MRESLQPPWCRACVLLALAALAAEASAIRADDDIVTRGNTEQVVQGAATLVGAGFQGGRGTPMVLGLLVLGDQEHLWRIEENDQAMPLSPALLKRVKDSSEIRIDDKAFEPQAYCEAVLKSSLVSLGAFANSAREDLTYADLFNEPWRYRGQVVHYEGTAHRIRRFDAPLMLRGKGIKDLYECWIFGDRDGTNPVCLVCTDLPDGVKPGERLGIKVSFDAYFFKRYRYQAADSTAGHAREAPLFIGRGFVVTSPMAVASEDGFAAGSKTLLLIFLGGVLAVIAAAFGLHWYFRRADRRLQDRIRAARLREYADPDAPGLPDTTPSAN